MARGQKRDFAVADEAGGAQGRDNVGRKGRTVPVDFTTRSFVRFCAAGCQ